MEIQGSIGGNDDNILDLLGETKDRVSQKGGSQASAHGGKGTGIYGSIDQDEDDDDEESYGDEQEEDDDNEAEDGGDDDNQDDDDEDSEEGGYVPTALSRAGTSIKPKKEDKKKKKQKQKQVVQ